MTSSGFDASSRQHVFWCPSVHRPNDSKVHHTTCSCTTRACRFSRESHDNISISPALILCPPRFPARKISKNSSILCLHYPLLCMTFLMNVDDIRPPENETKRNVMADERKLYIHTVHAMPTRVPYVYHGEMCFISPCVYTRTHTHTCCRAHALHNDHTAGLGPYVSPMIPPPFHVVLPMHLAHFQRE